MDLILLEPISQVRFQLLLLAGVLWIRGLVKTKGTVNLIVYPEFVRISQAHGWRNPRQGARDHYTAYSPKNLAQNKALYRTEQDSANISFFG